MSRTKKAERAAMAESKKANAGGVETKQQLDQTLVDAGLKAPKAPKLTKTGLVALPAMKRARKPKAPKICACGCGASTKGGRFIPGHDARLHGWALRVERGVVTLEQVAAADGQGVADAVKAHIAAATK